MAMVGDGGACVLINSTRESMLILDLVICRRHAPHPGFLLMHIRAHIYMVSSSQSVLVARIVVMDRLADVLSGRGVCDALMMNKYRGEI